MQPELLWEFEHFYELAKTMNTVKVKVAMLNTNTVQCKIWEAITAFQMLRKFHKFELGRLFNYDAACMYKSLCHISLCACN